MAIVRRLREHALLLEGERARPPLTPPGTQLPEFTSADLDGAAVTRDFFSGPTVVGVFSTTCDACRDRLPEFVERVRTQGARRVLAVVAGDREAAGPYVAELAPVATVLVEPEDGPVITAFGRPAFPSFYVVDGSGVVTASLLKPAELPLLARA